MDSFKDASETHIRVEAFVCLHACASQLVVFFFQVIDTSTGNVIQTFQGVCFLIYSWNRADLMPLVTFRLLGAHTGYRAGHLLGMGPE